MSAQASGVFCAGVEPPPESTLPSSYSVISDGSASTSCRSAWAIWPTFSSSVIRPSRSATRRAVGRSALRYGGFAATGGSAPGDVSAAEFWAGSSAPASKVAPRLRRRPAGGAGRLARWEMRGRALT